jgi:esterase/lipase superfamily enzyme
MLAHFYLECFHKEEKLIFGRFNTEGGKLPIQNWDLETIHKADFQKTVQAHTNSTELLLFIHGFWAKYAHFSKNHQQVFSKVLANKETKPVLIELIWQSNTFGYLRSWHKAAQKGKQFGHIIAWLSDIYQQRMHIMCHSMGGKLFEGILLHFEDNAMPVLGNIILYSVDLDAHIFNTPFRKVAQLAENITIFYHNADKTLKLAQFIQRKKRLGVVGDLTDNLPSNVKTIDLSHIEKSIDIARHSLFWVEREVQVVVRSVLVNN